MNQENQLIQFNTEITPEALATLQAQAKTFPVIITTETQYKEIYSHYQKVRSIRIAVSKKGEELIKLEKKKFQSAQTAIITEELRIKSILAPIETQLLKTRTDWEDEKERIKQEKADEAAKKQRLEYERKKLILDEIEAYAENERIDQLKKDDEARQAEDARLKQEKEETEALKESLEKKRLEFEEEKAEFEEKKTKLILVEPVPDIIENEPLPKGLQEIVNGAEKESIIGLPPEATDEEIIDHTNDILSQETTQAHEEDDPTFIEQAESELTDKNIKAMSEAGLAGAKAGEELASFMKFEVVFEKFRDLEKSVRAYFRQGFTEEDLKAASEFLEKELCSLWEKFS